MLTSIFWVPPPPNKRPLNAKSTTKTMITKITSTATTPVLPPPPLSSAMKGVPPFEPEFFHPGGYLRGSNCYHKVESSSNNSRAVRSEWKRRQEWFSYLLHYPPWFDSCLIQTASAAFRGLLRRRPYIGG